MLGVLCFPYAGYFWSKNILRLKKFHFVNSCPIFGFPHVWMEISCIPAQILVFKHLIFILENMLCIQITVNPEESNQYAYFIKNIVSIVKILLLTS